MTVPIYRLWHFGFGDHWQTLAYLIHKGTWARKAQRLSFMQHGRDFQFRLREMLDVLSPQGQWPDLVADDPTHELTGFDVWASPPVRTRQQWAFHDLGWHLSRGAAIVYQFDGISTPEKNPSQADQDRILAYLKGRGYRTIQIGKHLSVKECVDVCSRAALFVGVSSGMQCLAQSVGVPVYLLEYGLPVITCTRQKQFVICKGAAHFEGEVQGYLNLIEGLRAGKPS